MAMRKLEIEPSNFQIILNYLGPFQVQHHGLRCSFPPSVASLSKVFFGHTRVYANSSSLAVLLLSKSLFAKASNISSDLHKDCIQPRNKNKSLIEPLPNFSPLMNCFNFFILHSTSTVQNIFFSHLFSN